MAYTFPTNPAALGIVTQPSHIASPVKLLSSVPAAEGQDTDTKFHSIELEAINTVGKALNAGVVFIGQSNMNTSTGAGVIKSLSPGEQWSFDAGTHGNIFDPDKLYLQTLNDNDGVQVRAIMV